MSSTRKYVPKPEGMGLEFHRAAVATGLVHLQRCTGCGEFRHPPRWYCPRCHSRDYEFVPVSGQGTLYSMVVNHYTVDRGWADDVPYISAVVQLDEGPRVVGHLRGVAPGEARLGQKVQVTVEPRGEDFAFLAVELA